MPAVGFEPTQHVLVEPEPTPLDHSGKLSRLLQMVKNTRRVLCTKGRKLGAQKGGEEACVPKKADAWPTKVATRCVANVKRQYKHLLALRSDRDTSRKAALSPGLLTWIGIKFRECKLSLTEKTNAKANNTGQLIVQVGVLQWLACWAPNPKVHGSRPYSAILWTTVLVVRRVHMLDHARNAVGPHE